jgi:cytochrome c oxidase subunit 2
LLKVLVLRGRRDQVVRTRGGLSGMGMAGMGRLKTRAAFAAGSILAGSLAAGHALADTLGMPTDGAIGLQPAGDALRREAAQFHDWILTPIIVMICLVVLGLLAWIVIRYNSKANPVPKTFTHNTKLEVIWTIVPVIILVFIAAFSFPLLFKYHDAPKADVTLKATGNQWYWAYEYPDQKIAEYTSNPLSEADSVKQGVPYKLAVDNPIAIPGRVNEVWFTTEKVGKYYGECNELCGVNHSFMPIEVDVVDQPTWNAWVAKKATPTPPAAPAPAVAAPATTTAAAAPAAPAPATPVTTPPVKTGAPA